MARYQDDNYDQGKLIPVSWRFPQIPTRTSPRFPISSSRWASLFRKVPVNQRAILTRV